MLPVVFCVLSPSFSNKSIFLLYFYCGTEIMQLTIVLKCLSGVFVLLHSAKWVSCKEFLQNHEQECWLDKREVVAIILARGGSKGIPLKNLAKFQGESLLMRSLRIVRNSDIFSEIWVSTDSDAIAYEAASLDGILVHRRPETYALDTTSSIESVQEFLSHHKRIEHIALIQCTSVFLKESYLKLAFELFKGSECVFSVTRSHKLRWKLSQNLLKPINFDPVNRPRRQDWDGEFLETGMFYFAIKSLIKRGVFQTNSCKFVEIEPEDSLEIDEKFDLDMGQCLLNLRQKDTD